LMASHAATVNNAAPTTLLIISSVKSNCSGSAILSVVAASIKKKGF